MSLQSEASIQQLVVEYCAWKHIPVVHIPNEGKRSIAYGAQMKRMGLQKGFPDLFIPVARSGYYGLFIELKRDYKAKVTEAQKTWKEYLNSAGYRSTVCYGADKAMAEIEKYFGGKSNE